jgi:hypothetical protein
MVFVRKKHFGGQLKVLESFSFEEKQKETKTVNSLKVEESDLAHLVEEMTEVKKLSEMKPPLYYKKTK